MASNKKQRERYYLDRFIELLVPPLKGSIETTEEPDFLVTNEAGCLGIEVTELHRTHTGEGRPLQAEQSMRQRVIERANEIYELSGHPPVHASVCFNIHYPVQRHRVEELANNIVSLVVRNTPGLGGTRREKCNWENRDYFPEGLHMVFVNRLPRITKSFFRAPGATWVPNLTPEDIQRVLNAKERKYKAYLQQCDSAWLLINCDVPLMSTWFKFNLEAVSGTARSSFARVFVLRHFANRLYELRLKRES